MNGPPSFALLTPYFRARTPERQEELDHCLARNLENAAISRVVLLVDDGHEPPVRHPKLHVVAIPARPTYRQWIELSREHAAHSISILANSDIHFDDTLPLIHECLKAPRSFVALTRYEKQGDALVPHPSPAWSQDVWAVRDPAEVSHSLLAQLNVPLGVPRCDNKVAYLFAIHGWSVYNPQAWVRSIHVHETQQRHYDKKADLTVIGAVAYVPPGPALAAPSQLEIDVWALNTQAISAVRLNRSLDHWAAERAGEVPTLTELVAVPPQAAVAAAAPARQATTPAASRAHLATASPAEPVAPAALAVATRRRFVEQGRPVFDHLHRYGVYRLDGELLALDWLEPALARLHPAAAPLVSAMADTLAAPDALALFVPPRLDVAPIVIGERPTGPDDCQFWQYPCSTEKQAFDNHRHFGIGSNVDPAKRTVHTYLGLPWATYIDKKHFPAEVLEVLAPRLEGLHRLVRAQGYALRVHTVCQQIYWRRLVDQFQALGVTDLHLSHAETSIDPAAEGWSLRIHSWPLIAPNVEDPSRTAGLAPGRPVEDKRLFASFIGAHMPHYRSDVRLRMFEAAQRSGLTDVLVDLGKEWHFNKVVYREQVQHKPLTQDETRSHDEATRRYNETLSDSVFSLCPEGAGPNTLRVWESLAVGAIPVIVADGWVPPPPLHPGDEDLRACGIFVRSSDIDTLFQTLQALPLDHVRQMQSACMRLYQQVRSRTTFVSARPGAAPTAATAA